jgi:DNA topoisomerase II
MAWYRPFSRCLVSFKKANHEVAVNFFGNVALTMCVHLTYSLSLFFLRLPFYDNNTMLDEILVNASDNRLRNPKSCSRIDVILDPGCAKIGRPPLIRVFNDGPGIPIAIHETEQLYVPEMLFGHLMTGSNFDDSQKRITGGRHGYGAKLANIFSKSFTVETADSRRRLLYRQTWTDNMTTSLPPEIVSLQKDSVSNGSSAIMDSDYTCISFPDVARLTGVPSTTTIPPQDYAVMCRRVVDIAGCAATTGGGGGGAPLKVTLNGRDVSQASFADYIQMFRSNSSSSTSDSADTETTEPTSLPICFQTINPRWTVGVGLSESGSFEHVSFVNGMSSSRGGSHVNAIVNQVTKRIQERIEKVDSQLGKLVSPSLIRRHLFVAVDALIENPTFDSQMKEYLTSAPKSFGSEYTLSGKFLTSLVKSQDDGGPGIVEELLRVAQGRQQASLLQAVGAGGKQSRRQLLSIPKLEDAHNAGTDRGSSGCTLILTEGDSAKALAVAGLEVVGRERYGVFPLRGKFLNVRIASVKQLVQNAEVKALCSILGLDFDKEYDTVAERNELRYGHVMLMCDQDTDGSHIKGLVINFFRHFWPKLLKPPIDEPPETVASANNVKSSNTFLSSFVTPLLKASNKGTKEVHSFYSMAEYNAWKQSMDIDALKKWKIKYYKGLGTSTPAEAKEYFVAFDHHVRPFSWNSDLDGELLDMAFDKDRAADRREWILNEFDETSTIVVDSDNGNLVSYEDFINKEMIHFSHGDNIRSIPSVVDGFKPSQRKVLYACFKRNLTSEVKVAQLSGYCAEHTAYHHGEASLQSTIVGMAQDFVGSNNINLLVPSGQFGTRLTGGADAASPRYIFTYLSPIARYLYPEVDDVLLNYREDDGQQIEPEFFCPIIPLLLVNGTQGIGTGWSTFIPPHDPRDVLDYIRAKVDNAEELPSIRPFARGFNGRIESKESGGHMTFGRATKKTKQSILIDELPLRCWTDKYKGVLLRMRDKGLISGFVENHTTSSVSFTVSLKAAQLIRMERAGLENAFQLGASLPTTNMHAMDTNQQIQKYNTPEQIADAFFPTRLALYFDRKSVLEAEYNHAAAVRKNKSRFVQAVVAGEIDLASGRQSRTEIVSSLKKLGFATDTELKAIKNDNALWKRRKSEEQTDTAAKEASLLSEFDYLMNMPISSLTHERIRELEMEASKKEKESSDIRKTTPHDLWRDDLEKLAKLL